MVIGPDNPDGICGQPARCINDMGYWMCAQHYDDDVGFRKRTGGGLCCKGQFVEPREG